MSRQHFKTFFPSHEGCANELMDLPADGGSIPELLGELNQGFEELDRLSKAYTQISTLQEVTGMFPVLQLEQLALIESNLDLIGSNIRQDLSIPSLESYVGTSLSVENFTDRIKRILDWIIDRFKTMVLRIKSLFQKVGQDTVYIRGRLFILRQAHHQKAGRFPKQQEISLSGIAHQVMVREGVPHDAKMLLRDTSQLKMQLELLHTHYVPKVKSAANGFLQVLRSPTFASGDMQGWLTQMNDAADPMSFASLNQIIPNKMRLTDPRFEGTQAWISPTLVGDRAIILVDGTVNRDMNNPLERASAQQGTYMTLARPRAGQRQVHNDEVMSAPPHQMIGDLLDQVDDILKRLESANGDVFRSELAGIESTLETLTRNVPTSGANSAYAEAALRYTTLIGRWASEPYLALLAHSLTACRGLLAVSARSLNVL